MPADASDVEKRLRSELAEALRSNGQLQTRVKVAEGEVLRLRTKTKADSKTIEDFSREKVVLTRKLNDRQYEATGKKKLLTVRTLPYHSIEFWLTDSRMFKTKTSRLIWSSTCVSRRWKS